MPRTEETSNACHRRWLRMIMLPVLAALAGYGIGRSGRKLPEAGTLQWNTPSAQSSEDLKASAGATAEQREAYVKEIQDRLRYLWRSSPDPLLDWELKRETHQLLSKLTVAELEAWFHSSDGAMTFAENYLRSQILEDWARRDGPGAVLRSSRGKDDRSIRAFIAWAVVDREAALQWLRDVELPPQLDRKASIRVNFLLRLAPYDFDRVAAELPVMDAMERASTLKALALNAPDDPAVRERLRELAAQSPDEGESLKMESSLLTRIAQTDPAAARTRLDGMELNPQQRAELEFGILQGAARDHPAEAYAEWIVRHPAEQPLPEAFWPVLDQNFSFRSEEMIAWMDSLEAGSVRDAVYERGSSLVATKRNFSKAAEYAAGIEDRTRRINAMERLKVMWSEVDAEGSKQWLDALDQPDRAALAR